MLRTKISHLDEVRDLALDVRNVSVIAHVDHGKSTLSDSLVAAAGLMCSSKAGSERYMQGRDDEKEKGITIKSSGISLSLRDKERLYSVNLIDSPGHVDFSSEVSAALRVTDGAVLVVDCVEGVCVQTETVLCQALKEEVQPVLVLNKLDRAVLELQMGGEDIYQMCLRVIDGVNAVIGASAHPALVSEMCPISGNVMFGSGKDAWGFDLGTFARLWAVRWGVDEERLRKKLWGDWFFDPEVRKWRKSAEYKGKKLDRGFVHFVMKPILELCEACMNGKEEELFELMKSWEIEIAKEDFELPAKKTLKKILSKWINVKDSLIPLIVNHLPSPKQAQKHRYKYLYTGDFEDETAQAIKNCDPNGPLMIYISKMVPSSNPGKFFAFGRVFSGRVKTGSKVRVLLPNQEKHFLTTIQRTVLMMGKKVESVASVSAGSTVGLVGLDNYILKTGTITSDPKSEAIREMSYSVSPVVQLAVSPKYPRDLPKLLKGMMLVSKSDPLMEYRHDEQTGENIMAGSGELHLQICLHDLKTKYAKVEIEVSEPTVAYKESVRGSSEVMMAKSSNKHNKIYMSAEPLSTDIVEAFDLKKLSGNSLKQLSSSLVQDFGWEKNTPKKLWCFAPNEQANALIDLTTGCQFMGEIKEHVISGLEQATWRGPLCGDPVRGVKYSLTDTRLHSDSIHRGGGQVVPTSRRVCYASQLGAGAILQQPMFMVSVSCNQENVGRVYNCLSLRRAKIVDEQYLSVKTTVIKAFIPVAQSFGFTKSLREATGARAFATCSFDHYEDIYQDVNDASSELYGLVTKIRKRKGFSPGIPQASHFNSSV